MEGEALREGKDRVQAHLVGPLEQAGMVRKANVSVEAHGEFLDRLRARLAYMDAGNLDALREVVEVHATGKARDRWPKEIMILNWARRVQMPPPSESRLVRTYLQSAAGRAAAERGEVVELFRWLRKHGAPPTENYGWAEIARQAREGRDMRARVARITERGGTVRPSEIEVVNSYWNTLDRCKAIMADGSDGGAA